MAANKAKDENYGEDEPMVVTLEYDDGTEVETEVLGIFEVEGKEYIALIPDDDSDDVYLYGYEEAGDDEFELIDIEDEEEFEKVVKEFDALMDAVEAEE
ncbi:MAG: DUF1292 domain-containing protein [Clostridiales Family XIII bacterium]|nr:DUF1292 domain-containing protein [Clostridiales Family XIII bacterium]